MGQVKRDEHGNRSDGRFSRRHMTSEAHSLAMEHRLATKSPETKQAMAALRQAERDKRTPAEQLAMLDQRLGKGVGAKRERAKLERQIAAQK